MVAGRFIVFEGGEGTGKSTQARLLAKALRDRGTDCVLTREPGGTPGAEAIRELLLHPPGDGWGPETEALLFAAARADHVATLIRPAIAGGRWVVCDRFLDSSRAYQGEARDLGDAAVIALHEFGSGGLMPDLTIVLSVSPDQTGQRLADRDGAVSDAIGGRDRAYHRRVNHAFEAFAARDPARFAVVDGMGEIGSVHDRVMQAISRLC